MTATKRTGQITIRHTFQGGFATDFGPTQQLQVDQEGGAQIRWLNAADNVIFMLDGAPRKAPGTDRINAAAFESGAAIKAIFDYWDQGTSGSPVQHRVIKVGTKIKKDDGDGTFTDLFTGLTAGAIAHFSQFEDLLIYADDTGGAPKSWDGTTAGNLSGSAPAFAFSCVHRGRVWASGNPANPSRVYYSDYFVPTTWGGSSYIDINPADGDKVVGLASHKGDLFIWKGPRKGSIHRITGTSPTGNDAFAEKPFIVGLGGVGQNSIIPYQDDLAYLANDGTIRSLKSTAAYGDFVLGGLSAGGGIDTYLRERLNIGRLAHAHATHWSDLGIVLWAVPINASSDNNMILMMDYRFGTPRWATWSAYQTCGASLATMIDPSTNQKIVVGGGTDGFLRRFGRPRRAIDEITAIGFDAQTPNFGFGDPARFKHLVALGIGIQPKNNGDVSVSVYRDDDVATTETINQAGGAVLGPTSGTAFTLGTSALGGARFIDRFAEISEGGEFRSVAYRIQNNVVDEDVEVHSLIAQIEEGARGLTNREDT